MSKYFKDNGELTDNGTNLLLNFKQELEFVMSDPKVRNMDVNELRSLLSSVNKMVGNFFTDELVARNTNGK